MSAAAVAALIARERLPATYADMVDRWWRPLAAAIAGWRSASAGPLVIGLNGAQGSGKSTLCAFLEQVLLPEHGLSAVTLSLDDLYLTRAARAALAHTVHPLLTTRGVPGTHDIDLGCAILDALRRGDHVALPRFSKALDDRVPPDQWVAAPPSPDLILFEGWCVGAIPQSAGALVKPINRLEAEEDIDGIWRGYVNDQLAGAYVRLFAGLDRFIMLRPPDFASVVENRLLQERKLRALQGPGGRVMTDDEVRRFVQHYERLTRHMFQALPARADILVALDSGLDIVRIDGL
ncbi:kinase [Sphingomonas sp. So64.6b]|uniref:kinase n=1 Tax=Sphingomonas sp. So64.6b TaxID=2997354 RepID=UPI001FCE455A|nr:kinase [Sphingomonas sp. So64.6b]